jgi:hypothetical protein
VPSTRIIDNPDQNGPASSNFGGMTMAPARSWTDCKLASGVDIPPYFFSCSHRDGESFRKTIRSEATGGISSKMERSTDKLKRIYLNRGTNSLKKTSATDFPV